MIELDNTFVLIDPKAAHCGHEQASEAATGKRREAAFIHLPVSGIVVEMKW